MWTRALFRMGFVQVSRPWSSQHLSVLVRQCLIKSTMSSNRKWPITVPRFNENLYQRMLLLPPIFRWVDWTLIRLRGSYRVHSWKFYSLFLWSVGLFLWIFSNCEFCEWGFQDKIAGASSLATALNEDLVQSMTKLLRLVKMAGVSGEVNQHKDTLPDKVVRLDNYFLIFPLFGFKEFVNNIFSAELHSHENVLTCLKGCIPGAFFAARGRVLGPNYWA